MKEVVYSFVQIKNVEGINACEKELSVQIRCHLCTVISGQSGSPWSCCLVTHGILLCLKGRTSQETGKPWVWKRAPCNVKYAARKRSLDIIFHKTPTETGMVSAKMWWCFLSWGELIIDIVCWQLKTKWQSVKVQVKSKATQLAVLLEINQFLKHEKDSQEGPAAECYFAEMK